MKKIYSSLFRGALLTTLLGSSLAASAQTALTFNGSTKYVQANSITLNTANLSMECWVKVAAFKTTSPYISSVMGVEDGNNAAMLRFGDIGTPANKLQYILTVGTTQRKVISATTFSTNTWYHLAATYDGSTMRLYVNGVLDNTLAITGTALGTGVFYLGRNYEPVRTLNGSLDEARVWTRTLSATEIAASPCQVSTTATGLEAYWRMNEGSGTTTADATGHGHTGTLMSMVAADWSTDIPTQCIGLATTNPRHANGLAVRVLGNPAHGPQADIEIEGTRHQPVKVELLNILGSVVRTQQLPASALSAQRSTLALPETNGLYIVRISTAFGTTTTKLLKN